MKTILAILEELGIPFAYDHFTEGENPDPPFVCYLTPKSQNYSADGIVFKKINNISVELYTEKKDIATENHLEEILDQHDIFYEKSQHWIDSEKLYEISYQFDLFKEDL